MRIILLLLTIAVFCQLQAAGTKKFRYIAGYNNVQVMSINFRGIQIMHDDGMCYLKPEDLSDADKQNLAEELATFEIRKQEYLKNQKLLQRQRKEDAKKAIALRNVQGKAQIKEIAAMIKKYNSMKLQRIIVELEKKFDIEKNRNMGLHIRGLRSRVNAIASQINQNYPLASNRRALITMLNKKRSEVEAKIRAVIKKKKDDAKKKAEEAKKKQ